MLERQSLIDTIVQIVGESEWEKLPEGTRERLLFDVFCPAGGLEERRYHDDGPRYYARMDKMDKKKP